MKPNLVFQHGWICDGTIWDLLIARLQERFDGNCSVFVPERGYFGDPASITPACDLDGPLVCITHSLGLRLLPPAILEAADILISIASFANFHDRVTAQAERQSRAALRAMLRKIKTDPQQVISAFWKSCGSNELEGSMEWQADCLKSMRLETIVADLEGLDRHTFVWPATAKSKPYALLVGGGQDDIVPLECVRKLALQFEDPDIIEIEEGGHCLPVTHCDFLAGIIYQAVQDKMMVPR